MNHRLTIVLLLCLLCPTVQAGRARKSKSKGKRRARVVQVRPSCPPCPVTGCPDSLVVLTQAQQEEIDRKKAQTRQDFDREFAQWIAKQPVMSKAAENVLRETARVFYGYGKGERVER